MASFLVLLLFGFAIGKMNFPNEGNLMEPKATISG